MNLIDPEDLVPTRKSLLSRLKDWNDHQSWNTFFDTYWKLIYKAALKAGLTPAEAEDVVQETVISVCKSTPNFRYDPAKGTFKAWLLQLTIWRIGDQKRKRERFIARRRVRSRPETSTSTEERVPDSASLGLEALWDEEWERNLMDAAIQRVKNRVDPRHYQVFDCLIFKEWPASKVMRTLGVNPGQVYLIKHRISNLIQKEIVYLRTTPF